ncbi:MAG: ABC transporter permease, partial [Candidatus Kapabacteria bacterium]|nr:ABC transporter permease [Candidatus Kapabacteria bacterium]
MSKISVIISHEYRTRVRAKWFIISTLLAPFGLALIIAVPVLAAILAGDGTLGKVVVVDKTDGLGAAVVLTDTARYEVAGSRTEAQLAELVKAETIQAYVVIPSDILDSGKVTMYSRGGSGIAFESSVQETMEPLIVKARLQKVGTDTSVIDLVERGIDVVSLKVTENGVEADASKTSAMVGYVGGFLIYILIFLYGSMVMRGVVEEKANRIIEVLASSARPFEIMMGKVIGIGLVGLTQLVLWFVLGSLVTMGVGALLAPSMSPETVQQMQQMQAANPTQQGMGIGDAMSTRGYTLPSISAVTILMFIFNFFAGYFLYA